MENVTAGRGKVRPVIRVAAVLVALPALVAGPVAVFAGFPRWDIVLTGVFSVVMGAFYLYVGATGQNFHHRC